MNVADWVSHPPYPHPSPGCWYCQLASLHREVVRPWGVGGTQHLLHPSDRSLTPSLFSLLPGIQPLFCSFRFTALFITKRHYLDVTRSIILIPPSSIHPFGCSLFYLRSQRERPTVQGLWGLAENVCFPTFIRIY